MGNKGFTLVELLATVVILGLVMGIGVYGVSNTINNAKNKSENIFVDKLATVIEGYIDKSHSNFVVLENDYSFEKCINSDCSRKYNSIANGIEGFYMSDLIDLNLLDNAKTINPSNKKKCFEIANPEIKLFRDSDYVYYYYVDLTNYDINSDGVIDFNGNDCEISDDNLIISNLPDNLYDVLLAADAFEKEIEEEEEEE